MVHLIPATTYLELLYTPSILVKPRGNATAFGLCVLTGRQLLPSRRPVVGHRRHHSMDGGYVVRLPKDHRLDDGSAGVGGTRATGSRCRHAWSNRHGRLRSRQVVRLTSEVECGAPREDGLRRRCRALLLQLFQ